MLMRATEIHLRQREAEEKGKCLGLAREAMFMMAVIEFPGLNQLWFE